MKPADLETLLSDIESDRLERTISLDKTDKFGEAICAFANDMPQHSQPGYLFVGAKPDGTPSGAAITERLLEALAAIRSDGNIQPMPRMNVEKHRLRGGDMAVVEVFPSDIPPIRYKGIVWIRVGPSRRRANESEERALAERRAALARTFDALPCREASLNDLAVDLFTVGYRPFAVAREVIDENMRSVEEQLAALRAFHLGLGCPTHVGILLFGTNPVYFLPGAYVQYVRYAGVTQAETPVEDRRISGDLLAVLRDLDRLAEKLAGSRPVRAEGELSEHMVHDYPPRALHELFMNAVIHRSYEANGPTIINHFDDRIEIQNPGGLYGDLTPERFPRGTAYRNPVLAEAARTLGFVNRYGRGIAIIESELAKNESPGVKFDVTQSSFLLAIVRRRP
jgi:ATP-dependent DNA helicase RecG